MAVSGLIDTGAILALIDRRDRWHEPCAEAVQEFRLPFLTSEAVLTEVFHLVQRERVEVAAVWALMNAGAIQMAAIENEELNHIHTLMVRYADRPMHFADATLVYLARRESISAILTVDHADFETYRIEGRRRFHVLPSARP